MKDFVFLRFGEEQTFIKKAHDLGLKELVLVYSVAESAKLTKEGVLKLKKIADIDLKFGLDVKEQKNVKNSFFDVFLQLGTINERVFKGITHLYNNENEELKDFIHQRRSGLNHVLLNDFIEKNIKILFSYASLLAADEKRKAQILGRIMQNIVLCKKFGVEYSFVCLGTEASSLRNPQDVVALKRICE
jgi:RNase P/RNase MRP subunit p30